jgi:hypothetical protein
MVVYNIGMITYNNKTKREGEMKRFRLNGYYDEGKTMVKVECRSRAKHGTMDTKYIRKEKLKEMEECGYAYVNRPYEFMV